MIIGGSFGAGNYGMCGRAYWPALPVDVAERAHLGDGRRAGGNRARPLRQRDDSRRKGGDVDAPRTTRPSRRRSASSTRSRATPITPRRALWDDGIIDPADTRMVLALALAAGAQRARARADPVRRIPDVSGVARPALRKLLIANRGEIACRVIRTARRMGVAHRRGLFRGRSPAPCMWRWRTRRSPSVRRPRRESYLNIDAHHRGRARRPAPRPSIPATAFSPRMPSSPQLAREADLIFVGPPAERHRAHGHRRSAAKALMETAGVPVVPGYHGEEQDRDAGASGRRIGYPVLIKASAGGGGKGMRIVDARRRVRRGARRRASARPHPPSATTAC